jgi:hypothetical protein
VWDAVTEADREQFLGRMPTMLSVLTPRDRSSGVASEPLSWADYAGEWDRITNLIVQARSPNRASLAADLVNMDMRVYSVERKDGSHFLWSRRLTIRAAVIRGHLSVLEFSVFLAETGEKVIWPDKETR